MNTVSNPSAPPVVNKLPFPELWVNENSTDWKKHADEARRSIVELMYGGMPPAPEKIRFEKCSEAQVRRWPGKPKLWSYKIYCEGGDIPFSFEVQILFPSGEGPFPAIVHGDGCWWYDTDEVAQLVTGNGCALVMFNRTGMARDWGGRGDNKPGWDAREGGLYDVYPGETFGAISAWAWGGHRAVDLLMTLPFIDPEKIAVTGHSRGGKTALLAGLTDPRISLINDNASGAGGSAPSRYVAAQGETLGNIVNQFPHWFGPRLAEYVDREEALPFDQHTLLACLAPRPVLLTYANEDFWSNPNGMIKCVEEARKVYALYGNPDTLQYHIRGGGHSHTCEDWQVLLDFMHQMGFVSRKTEG